MIARLGALGKVDGENDGDYNKGACYISLFCVAKYSFFFAFYLILSFFFLSPFLFFVSGLRCFYRRYVFLQKNKTKTKKRFFGLQ